MLQQNKVLKVFPKTETPQKKKETPQQNKVLKLFSKNGNASKKTETPQKINGNASKKSGNTSTKSSF